MQARPFDKFVSVCATGLTAQEDAWRVPVRLTSGLTIRPRLTVVTPPNASNRNHNVNRSHRYQPTLTTPHRPSAQTRERAPPSNQAMIYVRKR